MRQDSEASRASYVPQLVDHLGEEQPFLSLSATPESRRSVSSFRTWPMCSCEDLEKITMSSKYTSAYCHLTVERMTSFVR